MVTVLKKHLNKDTLGENNSIFTMP